MKKVLFMHAGSGNHGCEAIVRTTAKLMNGPQNVQLWSFVKTEDQKYGSSHELEKIVETEEIKRFSLAYFEAQVRQRILHQKDAMFNVFLKKIFKNKVAVAIGGDNYCYPWSAKQGVEWDKIIRKYCKYSVLWGCSVDSEAITPEIKEDLEGFDLITARESLTYEVLKKINPKTVLVADPAFLLEKEEVSLPKSFVPGNTVGVNVSPLIMKYGTDDNLVLKNYEEMIRYILYETDMNICLIPHVVWDDNNDLVPLQYLYSKFEDSDRVCLIQDGNCMQLKGYISQCRFFVGARTHATIAAYSTCVPTLVIGYSIKARGIAKDLFGTEENYVLSVQNLKTEYDLQKQFVWLMENENIQKNILKKQMPKWERRACSASRFLEDLLGERK